MTKDNHNFDRFYLTGILPAPWGVPQIEVTFDINANDTLNVSTTDKGKLSKEEIERMVDNAEKFKADDEKKKEKISAKNGLESYCFNMKTALDDKNVETIATTEDEAPDELLKDATGDRAATLESKERVKKA